MKELKQISHFYALNPNAEFVLATLVHREGNSYRLPGARMLIRNDGKFVGCISGGCLEQEVVRAAAHVLATKKPQRLVFDTNLHFGCAGVIAVFLERVTEALIDCFQSIEKALAARSVFYLAAHWNVEAAQVGTSFSEKPVLGAPELFVETIKPTTRLVLLGGGVDALPLKSLAKEMGWHVVADTEDVSENSCSSHESPEAILERFPPDQQTAVVLMNHNFAKDVAFLKCFLPAGYPYVGLLGSRKRKEGILEQLDDPEFFLDTGILERLYAPAGLDLGGRDPSAVGLSIVAEIQSVLHARQGQSLRGVEGARAKSQL